MRRQRPPTALWTAVGSYSADSRLKIVALSGMSASLQIARRLSPSAMLMTDLVAEFCGE
jgi:hypothetical protein